MTWFFAALAVTAWGMTISAVLLRLGSYSIREDTDGTPYFEKGTPRTRRAFWLSLGGPTLGLIATLLMIA